jgi:hypothetical protein
MTPPTHRHGRHERRITVSSAEAGIPFLNRLEELHKLAHDWSPGYSSGQADVKVSGGGNDGSPAPPGTWQPRPSEELDEACALIRRGFDQLVRLGVDLLHRSTDTGRRTTTAICAGCDRTVACTHADPLRAGLCTTCDQWVRRQRQRREELGLPELDRVELIHRRRMEVADADVLASSDALG